MPPITPEIKAAFYKVVGDIIHKYGDELSSVSEEKFNILINMFKTGKPGIANILHQFLPKKHTVHLFYAGQGI